MATITETPEETLASALAEVEAADDYAEQRQRALETAQRQADAMKGFTEAAQLEFNNLEAKYRVLLKRAESASAQEKELQEEQKRLEAELREANAELTRAQDRQNAVTASRTALKNVTETARQWVTDAGAAVTELAGTAATLGNEAKNEPAGAKSLLSNAAKSVKEQHDKLNTVLGTLRTKLGTAERDVKAVPDITVSAEQGEVKRLSTELDRVKAKLRAKRPAVTQDEITEAEHARNDAQRTLNDAPETGRRAQAELREAQTDVAEAKKRQATALAAMDSAEKAFIAGIDLSAPDDGGRITATARLRRAIPKGYDLRWTVAGDLVAPFIGPVFRVDMNQLPVGNTIISVHVVRLDYLGDKKSGKEA